MNIIVKVNVDNITLNNNEMNSFPSISSMMMFNRYTLPTLSNFNNNANKGTVIRLNDTDATSIISHSVIGHEGNYLLYDNDDNSFNGIIY